MTRINVVPPSELSDNHLKAEYWELPRLYPLICKAYQRGEKPDDKKNPTEYVLGTGHVRFFYNKLGYITKRHQELGLEGVRRNIQLKAEPEGMEYFRQTAFLPSIWFQDYEPTEEALALNRSRLAERSAFSGGTYR